ncbi:MAG: DUF3465 domain-containing protein [Fimbriimonadaceae bacterium]|nr:DUF3465 domain-containing protein [Fimbriimonadaceae bacterium]
MGQIGLLLWLVLQPAPVEVHVALTGSDTAAGTALRPVRTLAYAQQLARQRRGDSPGGYRLVVGAGTWHLTAPLTFTAADSGTTAQPTELVAAPGARPRLVGGPAVTNWQPDQGAVLRASLHELGLVGRELGLLCAAGRRMELARYPNRDPQDRHGGRWAYVAGERRNMYLDSPDEDGWLAARRHLDFWQRNLPRLTRELAVLPDDRRTWANAATGQASIFPRFNWSHYILPITGYDATEHRLHLGPGCFYEIRPGDRYFVQNLREELDQPGEWCYDRAAGQLWFWPPEPAAAADVAVPAVTHVIAAQGARDLRIRGCSLECSSGSGVLLQDCQRVTIAACLVRNVGGTQGCGIEIRGGAGNRLVGNDIHDTGWTGIRLGGGDLNTYALGGNVADNNWIHHVGWVSRDAKGIQLDGARQVVTHNVIQDIPHYGILMWGAGHRIEYNIIQRSCLETEDAGAIGGGAIDWLSWQGAVIRYNRLEDTIGYGYSEAEQRWVSPYFTHALYPDWAASGTTMVGNLLLRAANGCLMLHSGRDNRVENNILVDAGQAQVQYHGWTTQTGFWATMLEGWQQRYAAAAAAPGWREVPTLRDPATVPRPDGLVMTGNTFRRNIVSFREPGAALFHVKQVPLDANRFEQNLYHHHGLPLRTGQSAVRGEGGPNLLANPGLEDGPAGGLPEGWAWQLKPLPESQIAVVAGEAHSGARCLRLAPGGDAASIKSPQLLYAAPGPELAFEPGRAYRFSAWLRAPQGPAALNLDLYSWQRDTHNWLATRQVVAGPEWQRFELLARLPQLGEPAYRPTMKTLAVRLTGRTGQPACLVDDLVLQPVELADEWDAWLATGQDAGSVVADPLFVDPARDDYRLQPNSPALKLGFEPLPFDQMGCYADALRATWPLGQTVAQQPQPAADTDALLAAAFAQRRSNLKVTGRGVVTRLLADDRDGDRHQRFILRLTTGQTLLVAHNIDLAPRLEGLRVGDVVEFCGEYEWNAQGGVIHWTHHDPAGRHAAGWLRSGGREVR